MPTKPYQKRIGPRLFGERPHAYEQTHYRVHDMYTLANTPWVGKGRCGECNALIQWRACVMRG